MNVAVTDRCVTRRHSFEAPLRVRVWKSAIPEQRAESQNRCANATFFATDSLLSVDTTVEVLPKMPKEITGDATTERLCTGDVVRVRPINSSHGRLDPGAQIHCHQVLRGETA
jgi:hypothetical protein